MLHFNSTTDALLVLSWLSIDHRCSLTNCGKVICLRNRNYRHDLYSPLPTDPHYITVQLKETLLRYSDINNSAQPQESLGATFRRNTWREGGEVLPKQTHRTAVIHPGSSGNATDLQGYKHPLQGYLHSYKKTVYFFLNFIWTSYHWSLIFQLSMRCRKIQIQSWTYFCNTKQMFINCLVCGNWKCILKLSSNIVFARSLTASALSIVSASLHYSAGGHVCNPPSCLTTFQLRQAWVSWDFVLSHQAHLWRNWMTPVYLHKTSYIWSTCFVKEIKWCLTLRVYHVTMFNIARLQNCTKMPVGLRSAPDDDAGQTIGLKGVPGIGKCVCHKHHNLIYHHCHHHTNKASPPVVRLDGLGSHHS